VRYVVEKVNVRGIVQRIVDKGFNVRLPTEKIKPMAVPIASSDHDGER